MSIIAKISFSIYATPIPRATVKITRKSENREALQPGGCPT